MHDKLEKSCWHDNETTASQYVYGIFELYGEFNF